MNKTLVESILKEKFGYSSLRTIQKKVIQESYSNKDIIVLCPTGGGKSLCYQLHLLK